MSGLAAHDDSDRPRRCLVIGGGISGLAAAVRLCDLVAANPSAGPRFEIQLIDSSERLGGAVETVRIGDYLVERGPDMFITDKPAALQLCLHLGLEDRLVDLEPTFRGALVVRKGSPVPVPESFQLLGAARIGPVLFSPIFSWRAKLRMALEPLIRRRRESADESVASFVRRRMGGEVLDRLVQPLVGGIYSGDPESLSLQATLPRFSAMERRYGSLWKGLRAVATEDSEPVRGARYGLFVSLIGGLSELPEAAAENLRGRCLIRRGTAVTALRVADEPETPRYRIELSGGESLEADAVILAVPAHVASTLVRDIDRVLSEALSEIQYASSAVVVSGHRLDDIRHPLDAFGLVVPRCEERRVMAVSFASRKLADRAPDGRVLLRTFVGGALQPELFERDDSDIGSLVVEELESLLGVGGTPDFVEVARHPAAMPQFAVGHADRVSAIFDRVGDLSGLAVAGNAYHGVGVPDCVASGSEAAEAVWSDWAD